MRGLPGLYLSNQTHAVIFIASKALEQNGARGRQTLWMKISIAFSYAKFRRVDDISPPAARGENGRKEKPSVATTYVKKSQTRRGK